MQHTADVAQMLADPGGDMSTTAATRLFGMGPQSAQWLFELETLVRLMNNRARGTGVYCERWSKSARAWVRPARHSEIRVLDTIRSPSNPEMEFVVVGKLLAPCRVNAITLFHRASGLVVVALTGLQVMNVNTGVHVMCKTGFVEFGLAHRQLVGTHPRLVPATARVHSGLMSLAAAFLKSRWWAGTCQLACHPQARHVVISGFSLGGALSHILAPCLRERVCAAQGGARIVCIAQGAPRTGNSAWARHFADTQGGRFLNVTLVAGHKSGANTHVDEVTTIPLTASGFANCEPVVVVADKRAAFQTNALAAADVFGLKYRATLCLASLNFIGGFSLNHRQVLH